ncbi:serine/threonine-protein kinase [Purpureocillium lavendulum]|uniref:Serine/threonine-protein kinase n=1 Tax=Purpureocillium lavendulum TaxID=1247861 RepID=A0AB34FFZ5_9HYPO|nr:serine/threonine-protein kinase [Purpureocillium lavendulum]
MNGGPYAIEALLHYQMIEQTRYPDADIGTWLLIGTILRLGLRMGYHKDPSHFPSISLFQGEIRRRVFVALHAMDIMLSLQMGLPRLIKDGQWDTQPPRNLFDSDFDEGTLELPPSRPESETTPMLHFLAKHRILVVVGAIADNSMSVTIGQHHLPSISNEEMLAKRLQDTYNSIPDRLKFHSFTSCLADTPCDILHRLSLTVLRQKGLIVLYWHHVTSKISLRATTPVNVNTDDGLDNSYRICIKAALEILKIQKFVEVETRPNGALFHLRLQFSSVVKHEFLMATIVLVTHMYRLAIGRSSQVPGRWDGAHRQEVEAALSTSRDIWTRYMVQSIEAARVAKLLDMMFIRLKGTRARQPDLQEQAALAAQAVDGELAFLEESGLLYYLQDLNSYFMCA